ncbi:Gamma-aminobutyric acid type B receptor subunit 2 [Trichoplax sp. H2]|nr:Gamma-aminobutyric acid type B receptor subunit 2 [Trichoplax sp. H2]|eukprot:RDD38504.1 Gamma-aminobutyric acid type B receptor subunit 2 [Trichoplax sp. H2]
MSNQDKRSCNSCCFRGILVVITIALFENAIASNEGNATKNITIGSLFSINGTNAAWGDCLIGAKFALNHINNDSRILKDYRLHLSWGNTQCNPGKGMKILYNHLSRKPKKLMILGSSCSSVTEPVAQMSREFNLIQISYLSSSPSLNNRQVYPNFFRTRSCESQRILPFFSILDHFNWSKIGLIMENSVVYSSLANYIREIANSSGIEVVSSASFSTDEQSNEALKVVKNSFVRVIYAGFSLEAGRKMLCQAYHLELRPPNYTWIGPGWFHDQWWKSDHHQDIKVDTLRCSGAVMNEMIEGYLSVNPQVISDIQEPTISKYTPEEWTKAYDHFRQAFSHWQGRKDFAGYSYDAIWAIAIALNQSIPRLRLIEKTLENFQYDDEDYFNIFKEEIENVTFHGVTGPFSFTSNGNRLGVLGPFSFTSNRNRLGVLVIQRIQNAKNVILGHYYEKSEQTAWKSGINISWGIADRKPPADYPYVTKVFSVIPFTATIIVIIAAVIGIFLALIFALLNVYYRNRRAIKVASPNINYTIIIGAILCYISTILQVIYIDPVNETDLMLLICRGRIWFLVLGFLMGFGALFAKTWRLKMIFQNKTARSRIITDSQLYLVILIIVLIGAAILTIQAAIDPIFLESKIKTQLMGYRVNSLVVYYKNKCVTQNVMLWHVIILILGGVLLLYGLSLAWRTRNIPFHLANDSKYIIFTIYNVTIFSGIAILVGHTLSNIALRVILVAILIIIATTGSLCLIFIPKVPQFCKARRQANSVLCRENFYVNKPRSLTNHDIHKAILRKMEIKISELEESIQFFRKKAKKKEEENEMVKGHSGDLCNL